MARAWSGGVIGLAMAFSLQCGLALAQQPAEIQDPTALIQRLDALTASMDALQRQIAASRQELQALHAEVDALRQTLAVNTGSSSSERLEKAVQDLREQSELQQAQLKEQAQTKVESVSKYPVKLSGLLLFSAGLNDGAVDDTDDATVALARNPGTPHGSMAATVRQTILGLEATGPHLGAASTSADLRVDFFDRPSYAGYTTDAGMLRFRTAHAAIRWPHTALIAAYDSPLISPLHPASLISQGVPPLAWSGNLWVWSPQLNVRHTFDVGHNSVKAEFGLIDPSDPASVSSQNRQPTAGESSRQPGYQARFSYSSDGEHAFELGTGGYYNRQQYLNGQALDAWAATADWRLLLAPRTEVSGELYRGRAIAGLGGGAFKNYVTSSDTNRVQGLDAIGGWLQLKARLTRDLEANAAAGLDDAYADELRYNILSSEQGPYYDLARNRTIMANLIFRPRAYLALSAEYRNLHTWRLTGAPDRSQSIGLGAGYIF